jgi:glycosyltransferase involved in cell wall biosynthesis
MDLKIVYGAPNRAHHYDYARDLYQAGMLKAFVCGFPRLSPRAPFPEIGTALRRVDQLQTIFIASQKLRMPRLISEELAYQSQIHIDYGSRKFLKDSDIFLFYNGCGLNSARQLRQAGGIGIVEAVNSHVLFQEQLLAEEHRMLGLPWHPFHPRQVRRRVSEVEEADYVLLPSTFVARSFLAKGVAAERLLRLPYPMQKIAGASEVPAKANDQGVFRVLFVGTISVRKGLRYLIEAFRQLEHRHKELWIVGPTASPSGLENIDLPDGVKFFGPLKGDALRAVYMRSTVFCLPSIEEGLALVLSEALSHGLPVIATENTGFEDLLVDGMRGMIVPIRDSRAIGECLRRLAEDKDFLAARKCEAAGWASRLPVSPQSTANLSTTLLKAFCNQRCR